jgi:hypothetical protein
MMSGTLLVAYWIYMEEGLYMMQVLLLARTFHRLLDMETGFGLMLGLSLLLIFKVDFLKLRLELWISRFGILKAVFSLVLKFVERLEKGNRLWNGLIWFGSLLPYRGMLSSFGWLSMMLLLLENICVVGAIRVVIFADFAMRNRRLETTCFLSVG